LTGAERDAALLELGKALKRAGYRFVTPTPSTQGRVLARCVEAHSLTDIFGWNRPFARTVLDPHLFSLASEADILAVEGNRCRCRVRFSSLEDFLFLHSGYPTDETEAVFFGPDTYRFVRAIREARTLYPGLAPSIITDIGAGSGAGGMLAERIFGRTADTIILADINPLALRYCAINAALNGVANAVMRESDVLAKTPEHASLIVANPPYLIDAKARTYRHGGGDWGTALSLRILDEALRNLTPGGVLVLYTGTAIADGIDVFFRDARNLLEQSGAAYRYEEMDPDVFGEELESPLYRTADRIAAVSLIAHIRARHAA
jgi:SAM-dependent methyltransferase